MLLDRCALPLVLAPLAGGPSTPELCAAVSEAGGLGFLAAGYLGADELARRIERTRTLTSRPFGVNLFAPQSSVDPRTTETYAQRLGEEAARAGVGLGEAGGDDDEWTAKVELLVASPVEVVSVTFGFPPPDDLARLKGSGSEVWMTVTSVDEAVRAQDAGADALVVQGDEAGGHSGGSSDETERLALLPLLQLVRAATSAPLVATGGIMTGAGLAAVLAAGARAGALGTAFLRCPEAGTSAVHREALARGGRSTALTRAFTGRLARGLRNRFLDTYSEDAPAAYPRVHFLTAPLRAQGRSAGDPEVVNLWAGEAYPLATDLPAGDVVRRVADEARTALEESRRLLG
jgi:nitronate monooxygenase